MMKILTSHWFSIVWTVSVMVLSIVMSIFTKDASYVARAGALVTLAGIFMTTRRLLVSSAEKQSFDFSNQNVKVPPRLSMSFWRRRK